MRPVKILIIQLARHGDIIMTAPAALALKKKFPSAHISLLVRPSFIGSARLLSAVDSVIALPQLSTFEQLLQNSTQNPVREFNQALDKTELNCQWDLVFNLSFSLVSSYLTAWLSDLSCEVRGYSRHSDQNFLPVCDVSAYFYAQVGVGRPNRAHLISIFAALCEVEVDQKNFRAGLNFSEDRFIRGSRDYIVVHPFASEGRKQASIEFWTQLLRHPILHSFDWMIVGAEDEIELAQGFVNELKDSKIAVTDFVGKTSFSELASIFTSAKALIACDSVTTHLASMANCPTFQLSCSAVNFFETGPLAQTSVVCFADRIYDHCPNRVAQLVYDWLNGRVDSSSLMAHSDSWPVALKGHSSGLNDFDWKLVEAIYMEKLFPECDENESILSFQRLSEVSELAIEQIDNWSALNLRENSQMLGVIDQIIEAIDRTGRGVSPLIRWFQTERIRLKPNDLNETLRSTRELFEKLKSVCDLYKVTEEGPSIATGLDPAISS